MNDYDQAILDRDEDEDEDEDDCADCGWPMNEHCPECDECECVCEDED